MLGSIFYTQVMKTNYFRYTKKTWLDLPTTTVLLTRSADKHKSERGELLESAARACPQILLVNCHELCNSCNQQLQPTAWQLRPISRHIAYMKDLDGSGTSAYTGCKKKRGNIQIKPIRAVSL